MLVYYFISAFGCGYWLKGQKGFSDVFRSPSESCASLMFWLGKDGDE